jgi:hypothetical protein
MVEKIAVVSGGQSNGAFNDPFLEAALKAYYGPDTALITGCVPGSPIELWLPGQTYYDDLVQKVLIAKANGFSIKIGVFNQGESNANDFANSLEWGTNYASFLKNFRIAIGYPNLYWITTILGKVPYSVDSPPRPGWVNVQKQQLMSLFGKPNTDRVDLGQFGPYVDSNPWCHYDNSPTGYPGITKELMRVIMARVPKPV